MKMRTTSRKTKRTTDVESLDSFELEEEGFIEGDLNPGPSIASFNFNMSESVQNNEITISGNLS